MDEDILCKVSVFSPEIGDLFSSIDFSSEGGVGDLDNHTI